MPPVALARMKFILDSGFWLLDSDQKGLQCKKFSGMGVDEMFWIWLLAAALACWLAYALYRGHELLLGARDPEGLILLQMGDQGEVAEWLLWQIYRCEAVNTGRLSLAVQAGDFSDDTSGIVQIMSRHRGFGLCRPGVEQCEGPGPHPVTRCFDLRGLNTVGSLQAPLGTIMAL